jgi:predicted amidohydrolase
MRPEAKIKKAYDLIFASDPLLLTPKKQKEYGEKVLHNLLLARTINTTAPTRLDLTSKDAESYRRNPKLPPGRPEKQICDAYVKARRERSAVDDACWDVLSQVTMVADGYNNNQRIKPKDRSHQKALGEFEGRDLKGTFVDHRLRIAAIGYRVKVSRLEGDGYFGEELCMLPKIEDTMVPGLDEPLVDGEDNQLGRTYPICAARVAAWENVIHSHVKTALDRGSKIVLLPEFAMPSNRDRTPKQPFTADLRELSARREIGNHFLFTGTRHDNLYNRGLVISKKDKKISEKDWWHYKTASAKGLGENIMGPYGETFPSYLSGIYVESQEAAITVAICYDTYDPTTFLKFVFDAMKDQTAEYPKIILVPSFNPNDDFVALLRDVSFLGRCVVIYVNGLHGDAKMFMYGVALSDIATNYDHVMRTIRKRLNRLTPAVARARKKFDQQQKKKRVSWNSGPKDEPPIARRKRYLQILHDKLALYKANHTLDHLITVEECPLCSDDLHQLHDVHCERDILYFNIDPQLIKDFMRFRDTYFHEKDFLVEPLWQETLLKELEERKARQTELTPPAQQDRPAP